MATHSSVLAWRIPGTGEPGGLPSLGSHRVRHDWSDLAAAAAAGPICLFCFYFHYSGRRLKKDTAAIYVRACSLFSSKSFIVSGLIFRSLIHFEFIFVYVLDIFELWCWRRLLRFPWTARRSNQSILKEINPEDSLEGLMLKFQYFGHLMRRTSSLEETLMLEKTEAKGEGGGRGWDG